MKIRVFGLLLLVAVGVVPLLLAGVLMANRAEKTTLAEVQRGNQRVAERAAGHISTFADEYVQLLRTLSNSFAAAASLTAQQRERTLKNYRVTHPHLRSLDVVDAKCMELATSRLDGVVKSRCDDAAVKVALGGKIYRSDIRLTQDFAPVMTLAVPLDIAGEPIGAAIAEIDLVDMWGIVNAIHVGNSGYARLLAADGTLVAHGNPEERRRVFLREKDPGAAQIRENPAGTRYLDSQRREVFAVGFTVPDTGWTVVVEQPIAEAYLGAKLMRRDMWYLVGGAVVFALVVGVIFGRAPIRAVVAMRQHAREVAKGNFDAQIELPFLKEMRDLAIDLNVMAKELKRLNAEIAAKERLSTFARVAAGLAHDLQTPIESIRSAMDIALRAPDDPTSTDILKKTAELHLPRLHRYVRDLRRLAHEGHMPLELAPLDPAALARKVTDTAAATAKWQGIQFEVLGGAEAIWADESLLVRALSNLVANAADACVGRSSPKVTVRVAEEGEDKLLIQVIDTGMGIPKERISELLNNDFRSSKRGSGVGLGLGVARHVVASHGGSIVIDSEEGKGSTFSVRIPRQAAAGMSAQQALRPQVQGARA